MVVSFFSNTFLIRFVLLSYKRQVTYFSSSRVFTRSQYRPTFEVKRHQWSLDDTTSALSSLQLPQVTQDSLKYIQSQSDALFNHDTLISGDSNEGNWGRRDNGQIVLFDWERFGFGSPAIDLAPLVSQMGTSERL